ncbi:MAG: RNA polymerase sigma factor [Bacteroidia bacterium]|nr:RNA polymerase sigma factor [Bacteroidia bacterium]
MTDILLIQSCQKNERSAQRQLFELHYGRLMSLCIRYAKNHEQAKDMLSKGFAKICLDISEFTKEQDFDNWMMKKMVEFAVNYLRERRQEYFITSTVRIAEETMTTEFDLFHQEIEPDESRLSAQDYIKALQMLPPSFRAVYNMSVIEGYSDDQVSQNLEISVDTCRYNLSKAKSAYYKNLQQIQSAA